MKSEVRFVGYLYIVRLINTRKVEYIKILTPYLMLTRCVVIRMNTFLGISLQCFVTMLSTKVSQ